MRASIWENGRLRDTSLDGIKAHVDEPTWLNIADPTIDDLEKLANTLEIPRSILVGKLRSSYAHADTYYEYTKIFAWHISPSPGRDFTFEKSPVVILIKKTAVITISPSRTGIRERIAEEFDAQSLETITVPARVIYLAMSHLLGTYEGFAERLEGETEKLEGAIPPWSRHFYIDTFNMRKEASQLLRNLRHFRILAESLAKGSIKIPLSDEETRILDLVYDRVVGAEETTDTSLEIIRDLISLHLDTLSHDMNRAMRLLASITAIVAVPSVIGSLLGSNLVDAPWSWNLWQVATASTLVAISLSAYFYSKGWLRRK